MKQNNTLIKIMFLLLSALALYKLHKHNHILTGESLQE